MTKVIKEPGTFTPNFTKPSDSFIKALSEVFQTGINVNKEELNENLVDIPGHGYTAKDEIDATASNLEAQAAEHAKAGNHMLAGVIGRRAATLRQAVHNHCVRTQVSKEVKAAAYPNPKGSSGVPPVSDNIVPPTVHVEAAGMPKGFKAIPGTDGDRVTTNVTAADGNPASPIITNQMGAISKPQLPGSGNMNPRLNNTQS